MDIINELTDEIAYHNAQIEFLTNQHSNDIRECTLKILTLNMELKNLIAEQSAPQGN